MQITETQSQIKIQHYDPMHKQEWDKFVSEAKNSHFFFMRDYMEYHSDRFSDFSLMVYENEKLIALLPANLKEETIYSHQGLTFGGLIVANDMKIQRACEIFFNLKKFLLEQKITTLIYKAMPYIYHLKPSQEDIFALHKTGAILYHRDFSSVIDLRSPIKIAKGRLGCIKKAKSSGLIVQENNNISQAIQMLTELLEEKHNAVPTHNEFEMNFLRDKFPENIKVFSAYSNNEILANVIVYLTESVIKTQYIASTEEGRKLGAVDLIIDYLLTEYSKLKLFFDFGSSTAKNELGFSETLVAQKEHFGARAIVTDVYKLEII